MDNTEQIIISVCTGYGGIESGLKQAGLAVRTVAYVEIEAFCIYNLVKKIEEGKMDTAPIFTDVKSFPFRQFHRKVHGIIGGYPCQPFSVAGGRAGADDPRHLWPWIRSGIEQCQPDWCFFENVEGHLSCGIVQVLSDLEELGYRVEVGIFSAEEVGAPHRRKRVFIMAYCNKQGFQGWHSRIMQKCSSKLSSGESYSWPARPGQQQYEWEPPRVC